MRTSSSFIQVSAAFTFLARQDECVSLKRWKDTRGKMEEWNQSRHTWILSRSCGSSVEQFHRLFLPVCGKCWLFWWQRLHLEHNICATSFFIFFNDFHKISKKHISRSDQIIFSWGLKISRSRLKRWQWEDGLCFSLLHAIVLKCGPFYTFGKLIHISVQAVHLDLLYNLQRRETVCCSAAING